MHFVRLLKPINFHATLAHLRFAIERRLGDTDFNRPVFRLPVADAQCRLQRGEADIDAAPGGSRLAGGVGHVRVNAEAERRLVLFRNVRIGFGNEFNFERAARVRCNGSVRDLLAARDAASAP